MYPVRLNLVGRRCLVVGGGQVALRKVRGLLVEHAEVTVIAPVFVSELEELAVAGRLKLTRRAFRGGDTRSFALVLAATDEREMNRKVFEEADAAGIFTNVADDPELCSFHLGGRVRLGPLELFVSSGGEAPFLVRRLREALEHGLDQAGWSAWAEEAARLRRALRRGGIDAAVQEEIYDAFFAASFDTETLTARLPSSEQIDAWCTGKLARFSGGRSERPGRVALVGAGPGSPGLLTLRGRELLFAADAVVFDRLAEAALPPDLPARITLYDVGKTAGRHPLPQEEINRLLVRLAREGQRVVRFKGGDPYVFGRGSEEAEVLTKAGIAFEIVPGVSSGIAAAAQAGIPVTHRGEAVQLTLVTAHESREKLGPQVRWDLLAQERHATLVGYMGVGALSRIITELLSHGMPPDTPAAMIERGTTSAARCVRASLSELVQAVEEAALEPPALFVIGPTVRRAELLAQGSRRELDGVRIICPRRLPRLAWALEDAGAEVVRLGASMGPAARITMSALPISGWVLADLDGVARAVAFAREHSALETCWVWCLDQTVADAASEAGFVRVVRIDEGRGEDECVVEIVRSI